MGATSMPVRDANGNLKDMAHEEAASGVRTPRYAPEVGGKAIGPTNPMPVGFPSAIATVPAGGTGLDYSANGASTPPGVLLLTIPADDSRRAVELQNQSAADLTMVRDDGSGGVNGAGQQRTSIVLASGGAVGAQGGGWSSNTFRGRIRVYGPAGSRISASVD